MTDYQPGKCNIGNREQRKRYLLGSTGFLGAGIYILMALMGRINPESDFLMFILFFIGFSGLIQGRKNFCAGYGVLSKENTSDQDSPENVSRKREDLIESLKIQFYSFSGAFLATAIVNVLIL